MDPDAKHGYRVQNGSIPYVTAGSRLYIKAMPAQSPAGSARDITTRNMWKEAFSIIWQPSAEDGDDDDQ